MVLICGRSGFTGLRLANAANILLNLARPANGSLTVSGVRVVQPDLGK